MKVEYQEVLPDPKRVIEGLRDTGYQIETAIEDIIDNSIAAEATKIEVNLDMDIAGNIAVSISDNGFGMERDELIDAMRYGSKIRPNPASLGKFGLGLKTASTAFCRQLSVISKTSKGTEYAKATWDLDHVAKVGKWELALSTPSKDELKLLQDVAGDGSGTLVVWNKVDRLLKNYADPGGAFAQKALDKVAFNLIAHSSMVYQRFLDHSDKRIGNIEIKINGKIVKPYNPFCPEESGEPVLERTVPVEISSKKTAEFIIRAYVLPNKWEFSSPDAYFNSRPGNENQGIYVYRENRLIHGPDWLRMYSKEPHMSLLRVEFSFNHKLDDAFHIDIKKSQIILNDELYKWLSEEFLPPCRRAAEQRYRLGKKKTTDEASKDLHDSSNANIHNKAAEISESDIKIINKDKDIVEVTNKEGTIRTKIKILLPTKPGQVHIQPASTIEDGLLWEPCLIDKNKGVRINTGHPYYSKVYLPNSNSGVTIQGLDSLLWAFCEAELTTLNEKTLKHFEEMRREVSRILRVLVEDLPEHVDDDSEQ